MKKIMLVLAIAIAALLAVPMVASAEKVELEGKGVLMAKGTGRAEIAGRLNFIGQARLANLVIEDRAGDGRIDVTGYGKRIEEGSGRVRYVGFHGRAHIVGSDVAISLTGKDVRFAVRGKGEATLRGKGVYRVHGGHLEPWSQDGITIPFNDEGASLEEYEQ